MDENDMSSNRCLHCCTLKLTWTWVYLRSNRSRWFYSCCLGWKDSIWHCGHYGHGIPECAIQRILAMLWLMPLWLRRFFSLRRVLWSHHPVDGRTTSWRCFISFLSRQNGSRYEPWSRNLGKRYRKGAEDCEPACKVYILFSTSQACCNDA